MTRTPHAVSGRASLLLHAALMVAVVGAYDLWRGPGNTPARSVDETPPESLGAGSGEAPASLTGTGRAPSERMAALVARVEQLEAHIARQEASVRPPVRNVPGVDHETAPFARVAPDEAPVSAAELARFRALEVASLHQRRAEQVAAGLERALDRLLDAPQGEERAIILAESLVIWQEAEHVRKQSTTPRGSAERVQALARLYGDLERTLTRSVASTRAEAVLRAVSRNLGISEESELDAAAGARAQADSPSR